MKETETLMTYVVGDPVAQGSMVAITTKQNRTFMKHSSKKLPKWRNAVVTELEDAMARCVEHGRPWVPKRVPYLLDVSFFLSRPKSHSKNEKLCTWRYQSPDLDKLVRAVMDALEIAGVVKDDARIASIVATKSYTNDDMNPGVQIKVARCYVSPEWNAKEED